LDIENRLTSTGRADSTGLELNAARLG